MLSLSAKGTIPESFPVLLSFLLFLSLDLLFLLSPGVGLLNSGVFATDPKRTSSILSSIPCLGDMCSVKTKSISSSHGFAGLAAGDNGFAATLCLGKLLASESSFVEAGFAVFDSSRLFCKASSDLFTFDRGIFV